MNTFIRSLRRCHCLFHFNDLTGYCFIAGMQNSFIWTRESCVMQEHPWRCFEGRHPFRVKNYHPQLYLVSSQYLFWFKYKDGLGSKQDKGARIIKRQPLRNYLGCAESGSFKLSETYPNSHDTKELTQRKPMHDLPTTGDKVMWILPAWIYSSVPSQQIF